MGATVADVGGLGASSALIAYALGAQAGEAAIRQIDTDAWSTRFHRAAETPFNIVLEARP